MVNPEEPKKEDKESFQRKISDKIEQLKENERVRGFYDYASSNVRDLIAYATLLAGLILLLFGYHIGGVLIGFVTGIYFSDFILKWIETIRTNYRDAWGVRSVILVGFGIALLITAPGIFIGIILALAVRYMMVI